MPEGKKYRILHGVMVAEVFEGIETAVAFPVPEKTKILIAVPVSIRTANGMIADETRTYPLPDGISREDFETMTKEEVDKWVLKYIKEVHNL